jgi:DNA-binding NarL/FixJ family response regulator
VYEILIIDPEPMTRRGLAMTLDAQPDFTVWADVGDAESALRIIEMSAPDIVISEVALPNMNGLALVERLLAEVPDVRVIIVSRQDSVVCAERALRYGAHGYLVWRERPEAFVEAVRHVVMGGRFVSPRVMDDLLTAIAESTHPLIPSPADVLSEREMELFTMIGDGNDVKAIAEGHGRLAEDRRLVPSAHQGEAESATNIELVRRAAQWCNGECVCFTSTGRPQLMPSSSGDHQDCSPKPFREHLCDASYPPTMSRAPIHILNAAFILAFAVAPLFLQHCVMAGTVLPRIFACEDERPVEPPCHDDEAEAASLEMCCAGVDARSRNAC